MKILFLVLFAIAIFLIEKYWAVFAARYISYSCRCSKVLVEPGESMRLECETKNAGKLPVMFVRVNMFLPENSKVIAAQQSDVPDKGFRQGFVEMRFSVNGRTCIRRNIEMSLLGRGVYNIGKSELSVGDFLGLNERSFSFAKESKVVVMPELCEDTEVREVVGGFLGDISVRRFIMEDPILTRGFREYTGREPLRDVSWIRTAVSGRMMVKEYDHTSDVNVMILLNLDTLNDDELEKCYSLTRTVCDMLEKANIEYGLRTNGGLFGPVGYTEWFPKGLGVRHYNTIMYALGNARKVAYYSFATLLERATRKQNNNENYIIIVPRADASTTRLISRLEMKTGSKVCLLSASKGEI